MTPTLQDVLSALTQASNFAVIPPMIVCLWRWRMLSVAQRFFASMLAVIAVNQLIAWGISYIPGASNLPLYSAYIVIESAGLLWLYQARFDRALVKLVLRGSAIDLVAIVVLNALFIQGIWVIPTYARTLEALVLLTLALYYFQFVFKERKEKNLDRSFWFWVSAGLLVYFSSNLLLFIFTNTLRNRSDQLFLGVWSIHAVLNFILYGFYSIALLCQDRNSYSFSLSAR